MPLLGKLLQTPESSLNINANVGQFIITQISPKPNIHNCQGLGGKKGQTFPGNSNFVQKTGQFLKLIFTGESTEVKFVTTFTVDVVSFMVIGS